MKATITLAALVLTVAPLLASAQSTKALPLEEVSESALVDALTPYSRTRSIRPSAPASASLLITFETNSASLTTQSRQALDTVAQALNNSKLADFRFVIEGHADTRGSRDVNKRLSAQRAEAVRDYLVRNHNIQPQRLQAVGKGDSEPADERNPAAPANRRVTFVTVTQ